MKERSTSDRSRRGWLTVLAVAVAALYLYVGIGSHGLTRALALAGTFLILIALAIATRSRPAAKALLVIGALPVAVVAWWSIVTPILAVLAVVIGLPAIGGRTIRGGVDS